MRILFNQGTPVPLRRYLADHSVDTAFERGWSNLHNGELLDRSEDEGYHLLENLAGRKLAILILLSTSWPRIRLRVDDIQAAINEIDPGDFMEFPI